MASGESGEPAAVESGLSSGEDDATGEGGMLDVGEELWDITCWWHWWHRWCGGRGGWSEVTLDRCLLCFTSLYSQYFSVTREWFFYSMCCSATPSRIWVYFFHQLHSTLYFIFKNLVNTVINCKHSFFHWGLGCFMVNSLLQHFL